jgi:hypothetical protein
VRPKQLQIFFLNDANSGEDFYSSRRTRLSALGSGRDREVLQEPSPVKLGESASEMSKT